MIRIIHFKHIIEERIIQDLKTRTEALEYIKYLLHKNIPIDHILIFEMGVYSNTTFTAKEYLQELKN